MQNLKFQKEVGLLKGFLKRGWSSMQGSPAEYEEKKKKKTVPGCVQAVEV